MPLQNNTKSWRQTAERVLTAQAAIHELRHSVGIIAENGQTTQKLLQSLVAENRQSAQALQSLQAQSVVMMDALRAMQRTSDGKDLMPAIQAQNEQLTAELNKFWHWLGSIDIVSSKTSYGEMLISAHDRVQSSRTIPEVNYEEHLLSDICRFLTDQYEFDCDLFLDIGANIGTQSVYMLTMNLARRVIAIEPDPMNNKLLRSNFIINGVDDRAIALQCALGDFDGEVEFELSKDNMGDHRVRLREYEGWVQNEQYRDVIKVAMRTPASALGNQDVDYEGTLIWLDAQGLEGHILTSFRNTGHRIRYFVCEYWPYGIECADGKAKFFEIIDQCEQIFDIRDMRSDASLTVESLDAYYREAVALEANHKVFSRDLLCIVKS